MEGLKTVTCSKCGKDISPKAKKCPECGAKNRKVLCATCSSEMDKNAKICPHCGAKNKNHVTVGSVIGYLILFFIVIGIISAITGGGKEKKVGKVGEGGAPSTSGDPTGGKEEIETPTVGNYIEGTTWKLSLLDAKTCVKIGEDAFATQADDGKVFLMLSFEAENISDNDGYINYLYFEAYEDGYLASMEILLSDVDGEKWFTGDVAAGKKLKGYLCYQLDEDWKEFEISYKDWIGPSTKVATFAVTPDNITTGG